ncbi:M28 family peptidase [Actinomycetospora straminea]|uniref:M28 family metallopeptidase n=1 Tax=Actinomycetospora straminea TaxID=663607 RepID=A0ABP9E077_9PSEU|nr:M28 family peptidase [Actinomycetospora straminea]MDD7931052.1 M28 family peptidase [Actinomycetospora straminea]
MIAINPVVDVARPRSAPSATAALAAFAAVLLLVSGCAGGVTTQPPLPPMPGDPDLPRRLVETVTADGAFTHLQALQNIAARNGGQRASGSPGHEQSVDYVADTLRRAGYVVETPTFSFYTFTAEAQTLTVDGRTVPAPRALRYSPPTPPGGITAPLVALPSDTALGCEAGDYAGSPVSGAIVLVRLGSCTPTRKQQVAAEAGAVAMIVANSEDIALNTSLDSPVEARIPVAGVSSRQGSSLETRQEQSANLTLVTRSESRTSRSVVAQTVTGRPDEVILSGAHLDSVPEGPGLNDDGSGSAAQLELALRLGAAPPVTNMIRFAWWGGHEAGLWGSSAYVQGLSFDARRDIAAVLNTDMIGSLNAAYFVYDGDDSDGVGAPAGPPGSAAIERTLEEGLTRSGVRARGLDLENRFDHAAFTAIGIPAGGLFTGAEGIKTPEEAALWGGRAGEPYDPCYHERCDGLTNVDRVALARMLDALAWTIATYGVGLGGPNGLPSREQRATL